MSLLSPSNDKEAARSGAILVLLLFLLPSIWGMGIYVGYVVFWLITPWGWLFLAGYSLLGAVVGVLLHRLGETPLPSDILGQARALSFRLPLVGAAWLISRAFLPTLSWVDEVGALFPLSVVLSLFAWKLGARWERATANSSHRNDHLKLALFLVPILLIVLAFSKKDTRPEDSSLDGWYAGALEGSLSGQGTFVGTNRTGDRSLFFRFQTNGPRSERVEFLLTPVGEEPTGVFRVQEAATAPSNNHQNTVQKASFLLVNGRDHMEYPVRHGTVTVTRSSKRAIEGTFDLITEPEAILHHRLREPTPRGQIRIKGTFRAIHQGR